MRAANYEDKMWPLIYDQYNHGRHEKELSFYSAELKSCKGPVLEVACGTGMILLKLLDQGIDIYGFDMAEEMLEILYAKAVEGAYGDIRKRISKKDMVNFHYDRKFDAIVIPSRSFLHLMKQEEQINCLKNIHDHLNDNGRLLLNFFSPGPKYLLKYSQPSDDYEPFGTYTHPETKEPIELSFKQTNDIAEQISDIRWRFKMKDTEHKSRMTLRWIYKEEFQLLLKLAGFAKWKLYSDFDKSDYSGKGEMIWVIEK